MSKNILDFDEYRKRKGCYFDNPNRGIKNVFEEYDTQSDRDYIESWIAEVIDDISFEVCDILASEGYNITDKKSQKELTIAMEILRASLYRQHNFEHSLHKFIDSVIIKNIKKQ